MGFFGTFSFAGGTWSEGSTNESDSLVIDIHDSDFATIIFRPATAPSNGYFYLGIHPRDYFDDPSAGVDVDARVEATGLADWATQIVGSQSDPTTLASFMAVEV